MITIAMKRPLLQSERSWYAPLVPDGSSWLSEGGGG